MRSVDHIIVGHGLAGATLELELTKRGLHVVVVDRDEATTTSRVAAGLMTPITGKRFTTTPRWRELWPGAIDFYRDAEESLQGEFFHRLPAVRLFGDAEERERFARRREAVHDLIATVDDLEDGLVDERHVRNAFGGFRMLDTGRLDVAEFLASCRRALGDRLLVADLEAQDVVDDGDRIRVPRLELVAPRITFCEGFDLQPRHEIDFEAAKGEILSLRIKGLPASVTLHAQGLWLTPTGADSFLLGATYDWDRLDREPTDHAARELLDRIGIVLRADHEVIGHAAAVRPIVHGRQPVVGTIAEQPRMGIINGLGSKGALLAPFIARMYGDDLTRGQGIDPDFDVTRRRKP